VSQHARRDDEAVIINRVPGMGIIFVTESSSLMVFAETGRGDSEDRFFLNLYALIANSFKPPRGKDRMSVPGGHGGGRLWKCSSLLSAAIQKYRESGSGVKAVHV
jgi:hypothetical protein